ncbi:hydrolase [Lithospermum erythrorhizon]|uniref:Hydrolase n=1 Tax=Lithospermum erythrorhizon TaxID=34254 RepID=A0AAV3NVN3_LITER
MSISACFPTSFLLVLMLTTIANGQPLIPALFIFGDSIVDVGNNNYLKTIVKANFLPYGRDFNNTPTGRFCNGKLATDFTAENLGFATSPLPYLTIKKGNGTIPLTGANFASGSSGYDTDTPKLYHTLPLGEQLEYYKEYQQKLSALVGQSNASSIISESIYLISAGNSDFVQLYYIDPFLNKLYSTDQFSDSLLASYAQFVKDLYRLGARRIGVTTLAPLGCLPTVITLFGEGIQDCIQEMNQVAVSFNNKLNSSSQDLQNSLNGLKLVILDIYNPLYKLIKNPSDNGFVEARRACCGTGLVETAILCNPKSPGTCRNASQYIFWDGFHPTQAANKILADELIASGISLIS